MHMQSTFVKELRNRLGEGRQNVIDQALVICLDFRRHTHPRGDRHRLIADGELLLIQRYDDRKNKFLIWIVWGCCPAGTIDQARRIGLQAARLLLVYGVGGDLHDPTLYRPVPGKRERVELDDHILTDFHKTDVNILDEGLDVQSARVRDDDHQVLPRRDDLADRGYGKLLHDPVGGRHERCSCHVNSSFG